VEDLLTRELAISQDIYGGDGLGGTRPLFLEDLAGTS